MTTPTHYDAESPNEEHLPDVPKFSINKIIPEVVLFPPQTRRGHGPGLITFLEPLPQGSKDQEDAPVRPPSLDPSPPIKWAEEGFAVLATVVSDKGEYQVTVEQALEVGAKTLLESDFVDLKDKIGVIGAYLK
jgi:carboxymethylenebutenolidase